LGPDTCDNDTIVKFKVHLGNHNRQISGIVMLIVRLSCSVEFHKRDLQ